MEINVLSFADYAQDINGKLTIVGTFNEIKTSILPFPYSFYLVTRFRFSIGEKLFREIRINGYYEDDKSELFPMVIGNVNNLNVNENEESTLNFLLHLEKIKFNKLGLAIIEIKTDNGFSASLPLRINLSEQH